MQELHGETTAAGLAAGIVSLRRQAPGQRPGQAVLWKSAKGQKVIWVLLVNSREDLPEMGQEWG